MRKGSLWWFHSAWLGVLTALAVVALSYLAQQLLGLPFFPFVLFDWLARVLPGGVITLGIDAMVRVIVASGSGPIDVVAKGIEQTLGIALWLLVGAVIGVALSGWLRRRSVVMSGGLVMSAGAGRQAGAMAGLALAVLVVLAMIGLRTAGATGPWTMLWLAVLLPGWGAVLGTFLERLMRADALSQAPAIPSAAESVPAPLAAESPAIPPPAPAVSGQSAVKAYDLPGIDRRAFLRRAAGGSLAVTILATGLGRLVAGDRARTGAGQPLGELNVQAASPLTPGAPASGGAAGATGAPAIVFPPTPSGRASPAPGTRPEITPTANFYRIDIDLAPPSLAGRSWQLQVSGLFDRPRNLTLADLAALPPVTQPITQSCISNPIGGDLISSAYYTGARLKDVLGELGLQPAAKQLAISSADGFYESVATGDLQDPRVLLVYAMNGESLPVEHGYPLRIYIPNHYGMKQPKWITSMQAIDHDGSGYWVDRGWSPEARPQVISIIDSVAKDQAAGGEVPIGGIAWAGDRGIRAVEVQVDTGAWAPAALIVPPLGPLTWVLWRYDWASTPGRHTFRVRATDGKGTVQSGQEQDTYPNGATGYHSVTVNL